MSRQRRIGRTALAVTLGVITLACAASVPAVAVASGEIAWLVAAIIVGIVTTIIIRIMAARGWTIAAMDLLAGASVGLVIGTLVWGPGVLFWRQPAATFVLGVAMTTTSTIGAFIGSRRRDLELGKRPQAGGRQPGTRPS